MKRTLLFLAGCLCGAVQFANAQQIFMQGWYWNYPKTADGYSWADTLRLKAASLKNAGITHIWFPPHAVASGGPGSNGYDPKDLFIGNTTTGLGTRPALNNMLAEFTAQGIQPVADVIFNHRDGGRAENNPPVKDYITNYYNAAKEPFPSDRFRCILPVGGSTGRGAGDYYFKISSKTGDARFANYAYRVYMQTNTRGYQNLPDGSETEPNGGGDCGQGNNDIQLGRNYNANVDNGTGCNTDEFHINLTAADFNAAGDTIFIYLNNNGSYSDHRIYGIYYTGTSSDVVGAMQYQTYTDFTNLPSGRGGMNYEFFKPNSTNASTTFLNGDWDQMLFYYDYDQFQQRTEDSLIAYAKWNWTDLGVRGYRMDAVKHFTPSFVGHLLTQLNSSGINPSMVVGEWYDNNASVLSGWLTAVKNNMSTAAQAAIQPKIFDFTLRENLRQACDNTSFDVRNVFQGSLHDVANVSGFNAVTFVNNHDFRDGSSYASLVRTNPLLAYAYILTNNQLGVPTIFYPDYYGYRRQESYEPAIGSQKAELDRLMYVLRGFVNGSPSVDYLNKFGTTYTSNFISGSTDKALIYQLQGSIAGGSKDVLVAINFANTRLQLDHQINTRSGFIATGTQFTDILGNSAFPYQTVDNNGRVYFDLPARSYSVWVQGSAVILPLNLLSFDAVAQKDKVQLHWQVADNEEAARFEIERKDENGAYKTIGTVTAKRNNGTIDYTFTDTKPVYNTAMIYRLKLVGKDGKATTSDVKLVRLVGSAFEIQLKGNAVSSNLQLNITATTATSAQLRIINAAGQQVYSRKVAVQSGGQTIPVAVSNLAAGAYRLVMSSGTTEQTLPFIKQ